jgi:hypothetical protein
MNLKTLFLQSHAPSHDEVFQGPARHREAQARRAGIQSGLSRHKNTLCPIIPAVKFIQNQRPLEHEILLEKAFKKHSIPVSRSSEIIPEFREFERASTMRKGVSPRK